jgi:hypothetical protein
LIGAARVSTTELLSRWRQRGILSGIRGRYRVDVSALRQNRPLGLGLNLVCRDTGLLRLADEVLGECFTLTER